MAQTIPMEENGILCGSVDHRTEGCYVVFSVDVPQWGRGMKKVWLTADSGGPRPKSIGAVNQKELRKRD